MSETTALTRPDDNIPPATQSGPADPSATDLGAPPLAGRYQLLDEIARGGMGVVYRATDTVLGREVAVKVLDRRFGADSAGARRFVTEARVTGQLQHPGIPAVHDLGNLADGRPFLAMKLVKGHTLAQLLRDRPDPAHERGRFLAVFEQVCQAVGYAHDHQVLHRDLKPANVMVGDFGEVQVMDWGLAKVLTAADRGPSGRPDPEATAVTEIRTPPDSDGSYTQAGTMLGTPAFMPPEQAGGEIDRIDERADVFGLGAILAVILTGQPPYVGKEGESVRLMAVRGRLADCLARLDGCGAEPGLVALAKRCLAFEPADRPRHAGEVAREVAGLRAAAEQRARAAELEQAKAEAEAREQRKRRRVQRALAGAVLLLLAAGAGFAWWADRQATARRIEAESRAARNGEALAALLTAAEEALRAGDVDHAAVALAEADRRLPEGGGGPLQARLEAGHTALTFLRDLDEVDQYRWTLKDSAVPDQNQEPARIRAAFKKFGLVPGRVPPGDAARRVKGSVVGERVVAVLDLWLRIERPAAVRELLRAADPDPYREAVRDALLVGDGNRLAELAARPEALAQPPGFAAALAGARAIPVQRRRQLLKAALAARPGDLGLLMGLASTYRLRSPQAARDKVRWLQAAVAAHPRNATAHNMLGSALRAAGDLDGAIAEHREAIRLNPGRGHNNLGNDLHALGDLDGAIAEYRALIRLNPKFALPHANLANVLRDKGDLDGAIAEYREAIRLNPHYGYAHAKLAYVLRIRGDLDEAIAEYRLAIRLSPGQAAPHYGLGKALGNKGDFDGAVTCFRAALALDPKHTRARDDLAQVMRWRKLLPRLGDVVSGTVEPATASQAIEWAELCALPFQRRYAAAARLYGRAFAAAPNLAGAHGSEAASFAALAGCGQGADPPPRPADRAALRRQALAWLRLDLTRLRNQLAAGKPADRTAVSGQLTRWLSDPRLAGVRPGARRDGWSAEETAGWDNFWVEVRALQGEASRPPPRPGRVPQEGGREGRGHEQGREGREEKGPEEKETRQGRLSRPMPGQPPDPEPHRLARVRRRPRSARLLPC